MSDKPQPPSDEPPGSAPDAQDPEANPAEECKVGPGRPPKQYTWKKGGPSPNPRGAPRKPQSMAPDLKRAFERALNKKVKLSDGEKKLVLTQGDAGIEHLARQFAKGDRHARRDVMAYADRLGIDFLASHKKTIEEALALAPSYQTILDAFLARRTGETKVSAAAPVIAPPELLDDDPEEAKLGPTPAPKPEVEDDPPPPPPPPNPSMTFPKPFDRLTDSEKKAWYPEWYAQHAQWLARRKK
jgi:uncharacterized protein DUF5681